MLLLHWLSINVVGLCYIPGVRILRLGVRLSTIGHNRVVCILWLGLAKGVVRLIPVGA